MIRRCAAEMFGTFVMVFAGTGAIVINDLTGGQITHVGVSLTFGLVVMSMICAFGDISGAHLNPAVTLGFWLAGRSSRRIIVPYIASQCIGALAASGVIRVLFGSATSLGATIPAGPAMQSFVLELICAAVLMFVILRVSSGSRESGSIAGIAVGAVIAFEALFAGPVSGASMNPARSLAPALMTGNLAPVWIYLIAPVLGAASGVAIFRWIGNRDSNPFHSYQAMENQYAEAN